jgi:hypothetical protein
MDQVYPFEIHGDMPSRHHTLFMTSQSHRKFIISIILSQFLPLQTCGPQFQQRGLSVDHLAED